MNSPIMFQNTPAQFHGWPELVQQLGVFCILLGEALIFGSTILLTWFIIFVAINLVYIPLLEEPGLEQHFGADYRLYKQNVPRWIPRLTPWQPPEGKVRSSENTPGSLTSGEIEEK